MKTHQSEKIELYHLTPTASALMHLPGIISEVVGAHRMYYNYRPRTQTMEVVVYWTVRKSDGTWVGNHRMDLELVRTAYSYGELEDMVRQTYNENIQSLPIW